jgi:hypothetical protein
MYGTWASTGGGSNHASVSAPWLRGLKKKIKIEETKGNIPNSRTQNYNYFLKNFFLYSGYSRENRKNSLKRLKRKFSAYTVLGKILGRL